KKFFKKNNWKAGGNSKGGGTFALIENGSVFEKVGVNISTISGKFHKQFRRKIPGALNNPNFWASGISVVAHMKNPKVPAFHFNTRFIVTSKSWFGGGMDMTPSIKDLKQKKYFHQEIKKMCNLHDKNYYSQHKKNCDQYFYLPHRNEPRGDGGIFYDYLNSKNWNKDFNYTKDVGITFLKISSRIIQKKMFLKWNDKDKEKQLIKRGRYVEFNLLYDRGTKFGLNTNGNIDAIFMSLPPIAKW
ncbi:MAG: oxygen-dependent coproporphyrinogen oxidase, partial [Proteobacteria bacterium]|nr:oxygen-dependent coproporphyrinogen oxidase [Pseudomonadota bacterium]